MQPEKECGAQRIFRITTEDGIKAYEVVEEIGSYMHEAERCITRYTRTHPTFDYTKETILEDDLQRSAAQS